MGAPFGRGVRANGKNIITGLPTLCFLLLFFNSGMVPIDVFPRWLQPVVRAQPMSPVIEAMRALAMRGYRVAAESGA